MPARTCVRARAPPLAAAAGRPAPVPDRDWARARAWSGFGFGFPTRPGSFLIRSRGYGLLRYPNQTRSAPLTKSPARQRMSAIGRLDRCAVGRLAVGPNGCDGSVRTVATVGFLADENALPERYK